MSDSLTSSNELLNAMRQLTHLMADFNVLYEKAEEKLSARETAIEKKLIQAEQTIGRQIAHIKNLFQEHDQVMSEMGAARWRNINETFFKEEQSHVQQLEELSSKLSETVNQQCQQLETTTQNTLTHLNQHENNLNLDEIRLSTEQGCNRIQIITTAAINQITELVKWFHWKNVAVCFVLTVFIVILTGLFINDEWPWEIHQDVINERNAGKVLLRAWPHLTAQQREDILKTAKQNPVIHP